MWWNLWLEAAVGEWNSWKLVETLDEVAKNGAIAFIVSTAQSSRGPGISTKSYHRVLLRTLRSFPTLAKVCSRHTAATQVYQHHQTTLSHSLSAIFVMLWHCPHVHRMAHCEGQEPSNGPKAFTRDTLTTGIPTRNGNLDVTPFTMKEKRRTVLDDRNQQSTRCAECGDYPWGLQNKRWFQ